MLVITETFVIDGEHLACESDARVWRDKDGRIAVGHDGASVILCGEREALLLAERLIRFVQEGK